MFEDGKLVVVRRIISSGGRNCVTASLAAVNMSFIRAAESNV